MPLEPPAAGSMYATLRAASTAALNSSTVPIAGLGAPVLTATPMPTRARFTTLSPTTRPSAANGLSPPGVSTSTSNVSPPLMRLTSAPAVSLSTTTLWPVRASNAGTIATTTCLKAPVVRTLMVSAHAGRAKLRDAARNVQRTNGRMAGLNGIGLGGILAARVDGSVP